MNNPWKFLTSYTEKDVTSQQYKFVGRRKESSELLSMIHENLLVTLYGKSGCGKTSLLQAGVFPNLRDLDYEPVVCRLNSGLKETASEQILNKLHEVLSRQDGLPFAFSDLALPVNKQTRQEVCPVIVLDQFEDYLRNNFFEAKNLLKLINSLVSVQYNTYEQERTNFRFVISIREDFLYLLEDAIDTLHFVELKENRYRLVPLSDESADEIISLGIRADQANSVLLKTEIRNLAKDPNGNIATNMLSLFCSELYRETSGNITMDTLDKQMVNKLLKHYYERCVSQISPDALAYLERHLINDGFRGSVEKEILISKIGRTYYDMLIEGDSKILQTFSIGEKVYVEFIHDKLIEPILERRNTHLKNVEYWLFSGLQLIFLSCISFSVVLGIKSAFGAAFDYPNDFKNVFIGLFRHGDIALDVAFALVLLVLPYVLYLTFRHKNRVLVKSVLCLIIALGIAELWFVHPMDTDVYEVFNLMKKISVIGVLFLLTLILCLNCSYITKKLHLKYWETSHLQDYPSFFAMTSTKVLFGVFFLVVGWWTSSMEFETFQNYVPLIAYGLAACWFTILIYQLKLDRTGYFLAFTVTLFASLMLLVFCNNSVNVFIALLVFGIVSTVIVVYLKYKETPKLSFKGVVFVFFLQFIFGLIILSMFCKVNPVLFTKGQLVSVDKHSVLLQTTQGCRFYTKSGSLLNSTVFPKKVDPANGILFTRKFFKVPLQFTAFSDSIFNKHIGDPFFSDWMRTDSLKHKDDSLCLWATPEYYYYLDMVSKNVDHVHLLEAGFDCSRDQQLVANIVLKVLHDVVTFNDSISLENVDYDIEQLDSILSSSLNICYQKGINKISDVLNIENLYSRKLALAMFKDGVETNKCLLSCYSLWFLHISYFAESDLYKDANRQFRINTINAKSDTLSTSLSSYMLRSTDVFERMDAIHNEWLLYSSNSCVYVSAITRNILNQSLKLCFNLLKSIQEEFQIGQIASVDQIARFEEPLIKMKKMLQQYDEIQQNSANSILFHKNFKNVISFVEDQLVALDSIYVAPDLNPLVEESLQMRLLGIAFTNVDILKHTKKIISRNSEHIEKLQQGYNSLEDQRKNVTQLENSVKELLSEIERLLSSIRLINESSSMKN